MRAVFLIGVFALFSLVAARSSEAGQQVWTCALPAARREIFQKEIRGDAAIDVWAIRADGFVDLRVKDDQQKKLVAAFFDNNCTTIVNDVEQRRKEQQVDTNTTAGWFEAYHTYDETVNWWQSLAAQYEGLGAKFIQVVPQSNAQKTTEGRNHFGFTVKTGGTVKPWLYFQCQIHAREWISGATCQYIVNQLLFDYQNGDATAKATLSQYNLAVNPIINPDGYVYTWTTDRLWRKNRALPPRTGGCYGVDINRNYDDHWGQGGSSTNACSDTYMGASPCSEAECKNSVAWFNELQQEAFIALAIDWHSYSQLVLRPYGWTSANSPWESVLSQMGQAYADAVYALYKKTYTSQKSIDLYVTTGSAQDWFFGDKATSTNKGYSAAAYTVELRPQNANEGGFELPPAQIIPTGIENYAGFKTFVSALSQRSGGGLKN